MLSRDSTALFIKKGKDFPLKGGLRELSVKLLNTSEEGGGEKK
jgi:hypothetical protein